MSSRRVTITSFRRLPWPLLFLLLETRLSVGPSDHTTRLPFALVNEPLIDSVPVGVLSVVRCCQLLVGLPSPHGVAFDPPVGAVTGVRFRSVAQHAVRCYEPSIYFYAAGRTRMPRIGS